MQPVVLIGSLIAILAVSGIVRWLRLGETRIVDAEDACRIAGEQLPGFRAATAIVSRDGTAALVEDQAGEVGLVKRHGAHFAARLIRRPIAARQAGDAWLIDSGDARFGTVTITPDRAGADKLLTMM